MKSLFLIVGFLLLFIQCSTDVDEKDNLLGQWEHVDDGNPEKGLFWIEFSSDSVLFSNSNNEAILKMARSWSYQLGPWEERQDTLVVEITESGVFSTNTGIGESYYHDGLSKLQQLKFTYNLLDDQTLQLFPTNNGFVFGRARMKNNVNHGIILKRSDQDYHWSKRMQGYFGDF